MMCVRKVFDESTFFPLLKIETFVLVRISKGSFIKEAKLNKKWLKIADDLAYEILLEVIQSKLGEQINVYVLFWLKSQGLNSLKKMLKDGNGFRF